MQHYYIVNVTRNMVVAQRAEQARSFWARLRGLMFRPQLEIGSGLVIEPNNNVHTFWMRFAIDVVFVDRADHVVGLVHAMPPNRPYAGARRAQRTIELPAGTIVASDTRIGDQFTIKPVA
jgi:hypothetical protein